MRNFKLLISTAMVAMVLMVGMAAAVMAAEKIAVKSNEAKDFNRAIQTQTLMVLPDDLEKKLLAQANEQFKFKVDRIFFDTDAQSGKQWGIFKNSKYPYDVVSRSRLAYLVTEQDGKIIRTFWMVIQYVDPMDKKKWSNKYMFQAPMNTYDPAYVENYAPNKLTNKYVEGQPP